MSKKKRNADADEERDIHLEIVREAIASTPDTWDIFSFKVTYTVHDNGDEECIHEFIRPAAHPGEAADPTPALYEATWKLVLLYKQHHPKMWSSVSFYLCHNNGDWQFSIDYTY